MGCEGKVSDHLNAENFVDNHNFCPRPPRKGLSIQIGHSPILDLPLPLTKRGVYRSRGSRAGLLIPPGCLKRLKRGALRTVSAR